MNVKDWNFFKWLVSFQLEVKQNLSRFEGKSGISSADLFGNGDASTQGSRGGYSNSAGPDLAEIREGVRQGVTKVAGKLSSLANGVMNSIQVSLHKSWLQLLFVIYIVWVTLIILSEHIEPDDNPFCW